MNYFFQAPVPHCKVYGTFGFDEFLKAMVMPHALEFNGADLVNKYRAGAIKYNFINYIISKRESFAEETEGPARA